jgi:aminoglycoside phosphotransferase (APT) family kinase protein
MSDTSIPALEVDPFAAEAPAEIAPVRAGESLDWERLTAWLRTNLPGLDGDVAVEQFPNGAANLTYLLRFGDRELVVRRPPFGTLAPGAHDMRREHRVLSRLWRAFDRAPRAWLFCEDPSVIGTDFFVMERRHGEVVRGVIPETMRAHAGVGRRIGFALVDAMAELHLLDPAACGLEDLGRPAGFVQRQVSGWKHRFDLVRGPGDHAAMDDVHARLAAAIPSPRRVSIVHNDLKLDNCQFDPVDPDRVEAIFDWDMTTLGDPLVDLGTLLNYWPDPADPVGPDVSGSGSPHPVSPDPDAPSSTAPADHSSLDSSVADGPAIPAAESPKRSIVSGFSRAQHSGMERMGLPTRVEVVARYAERTGFDCSRAGWYEAFALWKTVVVLVQLHQRWVRGESRDPRMEHIADSAPGMIAAATDLLDRHGL